MATLNIKSFPDDLYQILGERAKKEHRSLTSEVIYLLEWALEATPKEKKSILQLRGLGKKRWKDVEVSNYIDAERKSWE